MEKILKLLQGKNSNINDIIQIIIDNDININNRDNNNIYILEYAIIYNQYEFINYLLKKNVKIDFINNEGRLLYYNIIKYNNNELLNIIDKYTEKNKYVDIYNISDQYKNTILHYCIMFNNIYGYDLIVKKSDVNFCDIDNNNLLYYAIKNNNEYIIQNICNNYSINYNNINNNGDTILNICCNYDFNNIEIFLKNGYNIDILQKDTKASSLLYSVVLNKKEIYEKLIEYNANVSLQDNIGNTCFHYAIKNNNYNFVNKYINKLKNCNIFNIKNESILHIIYILYFNDDNILNYNKTIIYTLNTTNINIKDNSGNTILHYMAYNSDWKKYKDILINKKLDIFIKNNNDEIVYDLINKKDLNEFMDIVCKSYINLLQNTDKYIIPNILYNDKEILQKYIIKNRLSIPLKKNIDLVKIKVKKIKYIPYIGISIDIIFGLIYLKNIFKNILTSLTKDLIYNNELLKIMRINNIIPNTKGEYYNFEIYFLNNIVVFPDNFEQVILNFKNKTKYKYLIIPINIQINYDAHSNILIYNKDTNELERFEPYNNIGPLNYNSILMDEMIYNYFNIYFEKLIYFEPKKYIPHIGFMVLENTNRDKYLGDPDGFCSIWCMFYVYYRLKYENISRNKLIKKIINYIKNNKISFKNVIRSFGYNITILRDNYFKKINDYIDINDWNNNNISEKEKKKMNNIILKLIK